MKKSNPWPWIITVSVLTLLLLLVLAVYVTARYVASLNGGTIPNLLNEQRYIVGGPAMKDTLHDGQNVLVNKDAYLTHGPQRGDVIIFREPDHPDRILIKRVLGLPGDTITTDGSDVWVNGVKLNEPYITAKFNPSTINRTLQANEYFVMGDNRPDSLDSRYFGPVSKDDIVGQAVMAEGPQHQWQSINTYPDVYANVDKVH